MKKVFFVTGQSCGVHTELSRLQFLAGNSITDDITEADLVVLMGSCTSSFPQLLYTLLYINSIKKIKNSGVPIVVSGCLANGFRFDLTTKVQDLISSISGFDNLIEDVHEEFGNMGLNEILDGVLQDVTMVPSSEIVNYIVDYLNINLVSEDVRVFYGIPFEVSDGNVYISPVYGCQHVCSFCKTAFLKFGLRSTPLDDIKAFTELLNQLGQSVNLNVISSNFTAYGLDLYRTQKAHEVIRILSACHNVDKMSLSALIDFYPELVSEIERNDKVRRIFSSLETGSPRLYNTMNRPISLEDWKRAMRQMQNRPMLLESEIIAGYPGETWADVNQTLDVIHELGLWVPASGVHEYVDSPGLVASSKLPHQLSKPEIVEHAEYYRRVLKPHNESVLRKMGLM